MTTSSKLVGVSTCFFFLCVGSSSAYAAHPEAETDMSNDRGSQGNQEAIKGDSTPTRGQEEKGDAAKLKEDKKSAKQEYDKNNAKGQQEMNDKSIPPKKALQNKLSDEAESIRLRPR
jgi:hypothetical protein